MILTLLLFILVMAYRLQWAQEAMGYDPVGTVEWGDTTLSVLSYMSAKSHEPATFMR
jgi:hypothetical protein